MSLSMGRYPIGIPDLLRIAGSLLPGMGADAVPAEVQVVFWNIRVPRILLSIAVLHDISVGMTAERICALIGRNGSGKTTLMRCINGILKPISGTISISGREIRSMKRDEIDHLISLVPQGKLFTVPVFLSGNNPHGRRFAYQALERALREGKAAGPGNLPRGVGRWGHGGDDRLGQPGCGAEDGIAVVAPPGRNAIHDTFRMESKFHVVTWTLGVNGGDHAVQLL
ncbi:MAG TPA: ATP-binding cassette domain-containing protein [Geobacteraceae bacterium]|nr:ATP-binding cassette domain-containing protein [Geobacteraceae bacterium]